MKSWWQNLSKTQKATSLLIISTVIVWIGWDIYVAVEPTPGDTESDLLRDWAWKWPAGVWCVGALVGHFWGTWDKLMSFRKRSPWSVAMLGLLATALLGLDAHGLLPEIHPMLSFLAGIPFGALLWAQKYPEDDGGHDES